MSEEINKTDLNELTVKELQVLAIKAGLSETDATLFKVKLPLIATINALKNSAKVKTLNDDGTPIEKKNDKKKWRSKAERMRAKLMAQPMVTTRLPLEGEGEIKKGPGVVKWIYNEKTKRKEQVYIKGSVLPVQLNGFRWFVPKGVRTEVPQQIDKIIEEFYHNTAEAGKDMLADRTKVDPDTKESVNVADKLN